MILTLVILISVDFRLHVKFHDDDITVNGSETTWAIGTVNMTFTHIFKIDDQEFVTMAYYIKLANSSRTRLCKYQIDRINCSAVHENEMCSGCTVTERSTERTITANVRLAVMDETKNGSRIIYYYYYADGETVQQFTISGNFRLIFQNAYFRLLKIFLKFFMVIARLRNKIMHIVLTSISTCGSSCVARKGRFWGETSSITTRNLVHL